MNDHQAPIPNYLVQAILVTLFCCLPTGIAAIVFSAGVNGKVETGDLDGAREASGKAKRWCWISFWLGLASTLLMVVGCGVMFFFYVSASDTAL